MCNVCSLVDLRVGRIVERPTDGLGVFFGTVGRIVANHECVLVVEVAKKLFLLHLDRTALAAQGKNNLAEVLAGRGEHFKQIKDFGEVVQRYLVFELKPVAGFADQLTATVDDGTSYPVTLNDRGVYRIAKQTIAANNLEVGSSFTVKYDEDNVFTIKIYKKIKSSKYFG